MKPIYWIGLVVLAAISIILAYLDDPESFPAFYILFATGGAFLFVFVAKFILKKLLMRKEDYYDS